MHEILNDLFLLENDLNNHGRIEEKILVPKILEMEEKLRNKINKVRGDEKVHSRALFFKLRTGFSPSDHLVAINPKRRSACMETRNKNE